MRTLSNPAQNDNALLCADDPPAVTLRNPDGKGPGVILCDHASNAVPKSLNFLGLPPASLQRHIAYDIGAQGMAEVISDRLDMPAVIAGYSRLVIDLNRPADDFTSVREIYDGAVIPGNRRLSPQALQARIDDLFHPYHDTIQQAIVQKTKSQPHPAIISVHSCTDIYLDQKRPWHIGVLSNRDRRMAERVLLRLAAHRPDLTIGDNKPYSGLNPYGFTVETHALPQGRPNVLFEVRQDIIASPAGQQEFGELIATVLEEVLGDPSLFTRYPS
ncbi:MAG: N-formylglutamate amidohydrolase [Alphaproteobacteria bacterium]|nr:N-formylglutamate amidohydrolase [Alphaproteobacteria bacterium]